MTGPAQVAGPTGRAHSVFARALETEQTYFELGAKTEALPGAILAWTPAFAHSPAASVVQRVDPEAAALCGRGWLQEVESRLKSHGIPLARIYLTAPDERFGAMLSSAGYVCREELMFADNLPDPATGLCFRPVITDEDWARKHRFHQESAVSPDGHPTLASDLVGLERHKCGFGMECFAGEADGEIVGVIGAIWGTGIVRIKNVVVHPEHRNRSVATRLLSHVAALGRERGVSEQCVVALEGGAGARLYQSLGMRLIGSQTEWSRSLGEIRS